MSGSGTLFEVAGPSGVAQVPGRVGTIRIGRAADNDVVLANEPTVSRRHAELIALDGDTWGVRDVGSHNGTRVNGDRLADGEVRPIGASDVVSIGDVTVRLLPQTVADDGMTVEASGSAMLHELVNALSKREREVLSLVAAGRTDDQIAAALFISTKTVHSHLDRIRDKTGLRRRAELTRLAVRLGLGAHSAPS